MPAIDVSRLVVRYPGGVTAVDDLSFSAEAGQVVALLGPNGAGKTTTVETLEGYRSPTSGAVRVLDLDPIADHARLAPRIGVMLQKGGIYPGIRPVEAVRLFAAFYDRPEDPTALLDRLGLGAVARTQLRRLSGGEQQRLSLALALIGKPEVAFLDEPTAGVDVGGRQVIRQVIGELRDRGTCVLLATHELDEAERVADRVVIVDHGTLLASGTPAELMSPTDRPSFAFGTPAPVDVAALSAHLAAEVVEVRPGEYRVGAPPSPLTVAALTAWLAERDLPLADLRAGRQSLEDVFLRLTSEPS
ncbi:MAG TPA: ABC transporter ATP-binding protein [Acidimicrobiales bacterium]|jgi:ABC-2 type transport system ATP-binding protein|nr:ABC transporter ATP-binding protein [Acidimicrobiales bacterium]